LASLLESLIVVFLAHQWQDANAAQPVYFAAGGGTSVAIF
jgi:hypothetical protein